MVVFAISIVYLQLYTWNVPLPQMSTQHQRALLHVMSFARPSPVLIQQVTNARVGMRPVFCHKIQNLHGKKIIITKKIKTFALIVACTFSNTKLHVAKFHPILIHTHAHTHTHHTRTHTTHTHTPCTHDSLLQHQ